MRPSANIAGALAEIHTENLPITSLELYFLTFLFSDIL
jgi:hypothetical protein